MMMVTAGNLSTPGMTALRCFDAAARTGSFTRAAEALGLTQSAVSRQIAKLEAILGIRLFVRSGPYLQLTERGRAYAEAIAPALHTIASATARFRTELDNGVIALATLPSFGMRWLAPRLSRLTAEFPELVVNLLARSDEFDFAAEMHDAAIHFGKPDWPRTQSDFLFGETCLPVAAPQVLQDTGEEPSKSLARIPLLTLLNRPHAWRQWMVAAGIELVPPRPPARYEHFAMLIQATVGGAGAALIPDYLIGDELATGKLVPLSPRTIEGEGAYYLVYPQERLEKAAFRKFRRWLVGEAGSSL